MDPTSAEFKQELRQRLTPLQWSVTQERGTERWVDSPIELSSIGQSVLLCRIPKTNRAFTNKYYKLRDRGTYECVACGRDLFSSGAKYDSGSGWPAFYDVIDPGRVKLTKDASHGKTENDEERERAFVQIAFDVRSRGRRA